MLATAASLMLRFECNIGGGLLDWFVGKLYSELVTQGVWRLFFSVWGLICTYSSVGKAWVGGLKNM